jgi:uncharacterized phosphosugar-binding protein
MSGLAHEYLDAAIELLRRVRDEESEPLRAAAEVVAAAAETGGQIFAFGCTHSALPVQDVVYRAGGLKLLNPLLGPGITSLDVRPVTLTSAMEKLEGYAEALLDASPLRKGDVLIVVSVSGRNAVPIEMAQTARERGATVIGVTSRAYTTAVTSRHPSGKMMADFAHVVLDNKVDKGDAVLEHKGVPQRFCPASGVTSTALLQALMAASIEELVRRGIDPPVFLAANVDGGEEYNTRLLAEHRDRIHYL